MLPLTPWSRRSNRRGGSRTHILRLIRTPLVPLSYTPAIGPEGIEPTPYGLKVRRAAGYTTTLHLVGCMRFHRRCDNIENSWSQIPVVVLRIELSASCSSDRLGQPALDYHASRDGRTRTDDSVCPEHVGWPLPYIPIHESERRDSNPRSLGPRPSAIPGFATF